MHKDYAIDRLRYFFKPGSTAYTNLAHVTRSGLTRSVKVFAVKNGQIVDVSDYVATALDKPLDRINGGVKMGRTGTDMGYTLIQQMSATIHANSRSKLLTGLVTPADLVSQRWV